MALSVAPGLAGLLDLLGQSWEDRVRPGSYVSPSGTRIKYQFEDLSRSFTVRGTAFSFPGVNGEYIQQKGYGARRYPLRCYFTGANCDLEASAFEAALLEDGTGKLEHPLYGTIEDIVPFGEVTRRDDLKSEANQSVVEVTFFTTLGAIYPSGTSDPMSEIEAALGLFDVQASQQFANSTVLSTAAQAASLKSTIKKFLREVSANLQQVSDDVGKVRREMADIQSTINFGLDVLVGQPLMLARQVINLVRAPARMVDGFVSRLDAYANFANALFASAAAAPGEQLAAGAALSTRTTQIANDFHTTDLFVSAALGGSVNTVMLKSDRSSPERYRTRRQAVEDADTVMTQSEQLTTWRESGFGALESVPGVNAAQVDTGESYQALQRAVALAAGQLIELSFTLIPERRIVLGSPCTIVDLAAKLYGEVDNRLDFLIDSNNLSGDEILELPRGRSILYYPEPAA